MNIFEVILITIIYIVSTVYVYRLGYSSGARRILSEWRAFNNRMMEEENNE